MNMQSIASKRFVVAVSMIVLSINIAAWYAYHSWTASDLNDLKVEPMTDTILVDNQNGYELTGSFQVRNDGITDQTIKLDTKDIYTVIRERTVKLKPKSSRTIHYTIRRESVGEKKSILFTFTPTDGKIDPIVRIVHVEFKSPFEFEPSSIHFDRLKSGEKRSMTLLVKVLRGVPERVEAKIVHPSIQVERLDTAGSVIHYRVNMTLGENETTTGRIVLRSSEGVEDSVLVTGEIHQPVVVTPPIVYLHVKDDDDSTLVGNVIVSLNDDDDLGELQAQSDETVRFVETNRSNRRRRFLTVKVKRDAIKEGERLRRIFRYSKLDRDLSVELVRNR
jgi:hypothetical protein